MVSPVKGKPMESSSELTAAMTDSPTPRSKESSASTSRRNSRSLTQAASSKEARAAGSHSAARWNKSSIWAQRSGVKVHLCAVHFLLQPRFRHSQVAPDSDGRNGKRFRDLFQ